jgi:hypothetical protein
MINILTLLLSIKYHPVGMTINIRMGIPGCGGSSLLSMDVEPTSTIGDIKRHIDFDLVHSGKESLVEHRLLYFDGKLLADNKLTLKECEIQSQATLQLSTMLQLRVEMEGKFADLPDISLSALSSDTIDDVKGEIIRVAELAIEPSECSLYCDYKKLEDSTKLSDYDVQDGSRLKFCDSECDLSIVRIAAGIQVATRAFTYHNNCTKIVLSLLCLPCILVACCVDMYRNIYQNQRQGANGSGVQSTCTGE